jgi:hypothetical protein
MSNQSDTEVDKFSLGVEVQRGYVPVSYLSSLLRVLQAALREVALNHSRAREDFDRSPQPVLALPRIAVEETLTLHLVFIDPIAATPMEELCVHTFDAFLDRLGEYVTSLPQPGLWGGASRRSPGRPFESEVSRRMDQVYDELRRAPKAVLKFRDRYIEIEGDRMEIA